MISEAIVRLREEAGVTQSELARRAGMNRGLLRAHYKSHPTAMEPEPNLHSIALGQRERILAERKKTANSFALNGIIKA